MGLGREGIISPIKIILRVIISIVLIALQLFIYYLLFVGSFNLPYVYLISFIVSIVLVIHLYNSNDNVSYKIVWIMIILLFNVTGPLLYLCFGNGNNLPIRKNKKITGYLLSLIEENDVKEDILMNDLLGGRCVSFLHETTGFYPYHNQGEEFYSDGSLMFDKMIEEIDKAKKYIFLEYFIVASGNMLDRLITHLLMAKERGVEIKFIYDYVGCNVPKVLKKKDKKRLIEVTNNNFIPYNPLGINFNLGINYRDHRKILIVDGISAFVGGINIADEYIHEKTRFGFWRDNGMKITGDATYNYLLMFAAMWYMSTKEMLDIKKYKNESKLEKQKGYIFPFSDGPINRINPAYDLFLKLINNAKEKIYISTPYLVIDNLFLKAISDQAKSGLDVSILVPEIPDKKIVYMMSENNFKKLIDAGVKIYKYKGGFNHAKTLIVDSKYSVIGTINTDYRSMFLHFECGNFLIDTPKVKEIEEDYLKNIDKSILVNQEDLKKINPFKKIFSFLLSIFSPLV